ncbi:hypothetical protein Tco_0995109, partial [Tanacetum coccineum]
SSSVNQGVEDGNIATGREPSSDNSLFTLSEVDTTLAGGETTVSLPRLEGVMNNLPSIVYAGNLQRLSLELRNSSEISVKYFETMKEIGASLKSSVVFIPYGPGVVRDVATQILNGLLYGHSATD